MRNCYGTFFSNEESVVRNEFIAAQALPEKKAALGILRWLLTIDLKERLKYINIPTLIVHGENDGVCPLETGLFLHKNIKGSRLEIFRGAGHMPFYTRPAEFNRILEGFIDVIK